MTLPRRGPLSLAAAVGDSSADLEEKVLFSIVRLRDLDRCSMSPIISAMWENPFNLCSFLEETLGGNGGQEIGLPHRAVTRTRLTGKNVGVDVFDNPF